jgi:hypothetical protein
MLAQMEIGSDLVAKSLCHRPHLGRLPLVHAVD